MNRKKVILFFLTFIFMFCYIQFFSYLGRDEIWDYGFSYNISLGLIPYRDFNILLTPLFFFIGSIFIKIFGNYLYSVNILTSIVATIILFSMYKKIKSKVFILAPILLLYLYYSYNIFCLMLMILILNNLKDNKSSMIALLVSFILLSKQSIGICLLIPLIYYSKNRIKDVILFLLPILVFIIYLVYHSALYDFVNYTVFGMFDFSAKNSCYAFLVFEIPICLFLIYNLFKSSFKDKLSFYVLGFQIISYPIMDDYHFMLGFIIFLYYIYLKYDVDNKFNKYSIILSFTWLLFNFSFPADFNLYSSSFVQGRLYSNLSQDSLNELKYFVLEKDPKYDNIYILSEYSYFIKLYSNLDINKYDLINDGNMGYNGSYKYISEIDRNCQKNSCLFILGSTQENQTNREILKYVSKNYHKQNMLIDYFSVYDNRK